MRTIGVLSFFARIVRYLDLRGVAARSSLSSNSKSLASPTVCLPVPVLQSIVAHETDAMQFSSGAINRNGSETNNTATDWLSEFLPVEPVDLQTMIPLSDQIQPHDMLVPGVATREAPYLSDLGWIGDANDMAWLSLVPSWGGQDQNVGV